MQGVEFCAGSKTGAIALVDARHQVHLTTDGTPVRIYAGKQVSALAVAGGHVLIGQCDGRVVRGSEDGEPKVLFEDIRRACIRAVALDQSGEVMMAGSESGRLYRGGLDPNSWSRVGDGPPVVALAMSRDGTTFAVARAHKELSIFGIGSPRTPFARIHKPEIVRDMAFSNDGHILAVVFDDNSVSLHMVQGGHQIMAISAKFDTIESVIFNADNELVGYFHKGGMLFGMDLQRELTGERSR